MDSTSSGGMGCKKVFVVRSMWGFVGWIVLSMGLAWHNAPANPTGGQVVPGGDWSLPEFITAKDWTVRIGSGVYGIRVKEPIAIALRLDLYRHKMPFWKRKRRVVGLANFNPDDHREANFVAFPESRIWLVAGLFLVILAVMAKASRRRSLGVNSSSGKETPPVVRPPLRN